jgi:tellurite resistance protein
MPTTPPEDNLSILRKAVDKLVKQGVADGMRRAAHLIAIAAGKMDAEQRSKLSALVEQLEEEIVVAEDSAQE